MVAVPLRVVHTAPRVAVPPRSSTPSPFLQFVALHGFLAHSGAMHTFLGMLRNRLDQYNSRCLDPQDRSGKHPGQAVRFDIAALDARNHGLSPHTPTHSLEDLVEDLDEYLSSHVHQPTTVVAVGHSMGSMTWSKYLMGRSASSGSATTELNIAAFISLDMPPVTASAMPGSLVQELLDIIEYMKKVHLDSITDIRSATEEFRRCGMTDIRTRGLCTTNILLSPPTPGGSTTHQTSSVARWKCHVPVLEESLRTRALFFSDSYAKTSSAATPPSIQGVPVLSILGGCSPIGGNATLQQLWPRYASDVEQHILPAATHTVYYDRPRDVVDMVDAFLSRIGLLHPPAAP